MDKTRYFSGETYLPQSDYWALAGSTLITRENRNGRRAFTVSGNHSVRSGKLHMNIRSELRYGYRRYPAYIYEQPVMNHTHLYDAVIKMIGNFSSHFMPTLEASTTYNDRRSGETRFRWLEQKLGLYLRAMLSRSLELNSTNDLLWNIRRPDIPGMERFGVVSNLSLDYLFDDQGDFRLKVELHDVLNRRQRVRVSVEDEYVSQNYSHFLGRHFVIRMVYRF